MTICDNCGISFFDDSFRKKKHHYCSDTCRIAIYARLQLRKQIINAIDNKSLDSIKHMKLSKIIKCGFDVVVKEKYC